MKKLVLVLMFSVLPAAFYGQAAFDKFDGQDDVTSVIVNKKMFEMMGSVKMDNKDKVSQQYLNLIKRKKKNRMEHKAKIVRILSTTILRDHQVYISRVLIPGIEIIVVILPSGIKLQLEIVSLDKKRSYTRPGF